MAFYGWLMGDKERNSWKLTSPLFHWICNPPEPTNGLQIRWNRNKIKNSVLSLCLNNLLLSNYFPKLAT